jgi:phosphatidylinositol-3-phosphatase
MCTKIIFLAVSVAGGATSLVAPSHTVVAIFENHAPSQIIGVAPYFTALANAGAYMTNSHEVGNPSQPNYLGLFCGSTLGITSDTCPLTFSSSNLARQLIDAGYKFTGYSEGLRPTEPLACSSAEGYRRKHAPWTNFPGLPMSDVHKPFSAFPSDFNTLPTVSFVGACGGKPARLGIVLPER